jgi:uncharacterized protein (TIGR03435 family)
MRIAALAALVSSIGAAWLNAVAQSPPVSAGPTFDVVSIKRAPADARGSGNSQRPDGGFTMTNGGVGTLIALAYPPHVPRDIVGLPEWAMEERYDVIATSTRGGASRADRNAMMRAMLADRFRLVVHEEPREHPAYDLVLARSDGRLGPGLKRLDVDCEAVSAERRAASDAALAAGTAPPPPLRVPPTGPMPPCTGRVYFTKMDAQATMAEIAQAFTNMATSPSRVIDKTGLAGSYQVTMEFDPVATRRLNVTAPLTDGPPTLFTAVQEQLGLKLEPSREVRETLIVDRIERPTEN